MPIQTFNPPVKPSAGLRSKPEIKIAKASFGDGYTQSSPDGINYVRQVVELTWDVLTASQASSITTFFSSQGGYLSFLYQIPGDSMQIKYTCDDWSDTHLSNGLHKITATFRQSFNL
ncbi:phage tail protein [Methylocapsa aurea]|uniref:phage tail protein n=1 Tax=Methylocapsa aurea TaxID=663610 RepID=UPI0005657A55|nr:phage tail protein [Methylocapsa aurea]